MLVVRCRFVLCQNPHSRRYQFVHRFAARPHRGAEYSLLAEPNADHCCDEYEAFFPADVVRDGVPAQVLCAPDAPSFMGIRAGLRWFALSPSMEQSL
jgi:hypothetical protein